jgi:hypothetical protein
MTSTPPTMNEVNTFVSYSHDSNEHKARVLTFTQTLRNMSITAFCDRFFESKPPQSWPRWTLRSVRNSQFVLMVCTEPYRRRVEGDESPGAGLGANWEGTLITQELYEHTYEPVKFVPVIFDDAEKASIPMFVRGTSHYLVGHLLGQDLVIPAPVTLPNDAKKSIPSEPRGGLVAPSRRSLSTYVETKERDSHTIWQLPNNEAWEELHDILNGNTWNDSGSVLHHVLSHVQREGARSALIEHNYIDADYKSEWTVGYSESFNPPAAYTQRVHFFSNELPVGGIPDLDEGRYLGFTTIRPTSSGAIGTTIVKPPLNWRKTAVSITVEVALLGQKLIGHGAPYTGTDRNIGRGSAATAAWMAYRMAESVYRLRHLDLADFTVRSRPSIGLPSANRHQYMTGTDLTKLLDEFGLPPTILEIQHSKTVTTIEAYLQSGIPCLAVADDNEVQLLIGYDNVSQRFLVHDEDLGPYCSPSNTPQDGFVFVPIPSVVTLDPEAVILTSGYLEERFRDEYSSTVDWPNEPTFRPVLVDSATFSTTLLQRGVSRLIRDVYVSISLPRYVWVNEIVDSQRESLGQPSVIGEIVFDASSPSRDPQVIAMNAAGALWVHDSTTVYDSLSSSEPYLSLGAHV